jgi:hypothetical protein
MIFGTGHLVVARRPSFHRLLTTLTVRPSGPCGILGISPGEDLRWNTPLQLWLTNRSSAESIEIRALACVGWSRLWS